jgi:glycine cleavage system H protein
MLALSTRRSFAKLYTRTHEWIDVAGSIATVGITRHSADHIGQILWAGVLPGRKAKIGEELGDIESLSHAITVLAPVSGTVVEVNPKLRENPELINAAPETEGWIAKLRIYDPPVLSKLLDAAAYQQFASAQKQ